MPTEDEIQVACVVESQDTGEKDDVFVAEWLDDPELKEWLKPCREDVSKAICVACNCIINADKNVLLQHAASTSHEDAINARSFHNLLGDGLQDTGTSTTMKTIPARKIILIKRDIGGTVKLENNVHIVQNQKLSSSSNSAQRETIRWNPNVQTIKRVTADDYRDENALKRKPKPFRPEWLKMDIFRDWLAPDPDNPCKAKCVACNTVLNAGKSELEKHAVGAKHTDNLNALRQSLVMQQMLSDGNADDDDVDDYDDDDDDDDYERFLVRNNENVTAGSISERHLEVLGRISDSLDNLTAVTTAGFEKLAELNESLLQNITSVLNKLN